MKTFNLIFGFIQTVGGTLVAVVPNYFYAIYKVFSLQQTIVESQLNRF